MAVHGSPGCDGWRDRPSRTTTSGRCRCGVSAADGTLGNIIDIDPSIPINSGSPPQATYEKAAMAVDADGSAWVAWTHRGSDVPPTMRLRRIAPDSSTGPPFELGPGERDVRIDGPVSITVGGGRTTVAWGPLESDTLVRQATVGGPIGVTRRLGPDTSGGAALATGSEGTVTAVWTRGMDRSIVEGRRIAPDGRLGPVTRLSPTPLTLTVQRLPGVRGRCLRSLRAPVRLVIAPPDRLRSLRVVLDSRTLRRTRATKLTVRVARLRPGRHRLRVIAETLGARATETRTFRGCG
ncbi:MAG: hypothetical protein ACXVE9_12445 [Solirubrobacteraceae bacterium]